MPKSAGRGESVTSTDGVPMAMELADEMDTEGREKELLWVLLCRLLCVL